MQAQAKSGKISKLPKVNQTLRKRRPSSAATSCRGSTRTLSTKMKHPPTTLNRSTLSPRRARRCPSFPARIARRPKTSRWERTTGRFKPRKVSSSDSRIKNKSTISFTRFRSAKIRQPPNLLQASSRKSLRSFLRLSLSCRPSQGRAKVRKRWGRTA